MTNEEYLKLFGNVNEQKKNEQKKNEEIGLIKETPNYNNMPSINETPDVSQFNIKENLNDGWDNNFDVQFETRINGEVQRPNSIYEQKKTRRNQQEDLNGLNKYLEEENLNEVMNYNHINEIDMSGDVMTVEMFNMMRKAAMDQVYQRLNS